MGVSDFTTEANVLSDLPKRTGKGFFFSVSLNVTTVGRIFSQPFEKAIPKPDEQENESSGPAKTAGLVRLGFLGSVGPYKGGRP